MWVQKGVCVTTMNKTKVDAVIDAISSIEPDAPQTGCQKCGGSRFTQRRPLGGPLIKICSQCGEKIYIGGFRSIQFIEAKKPHTQGTGRGPTYSPRTPPKKVDKHQPVYRKKGKSK